MLSQFIIIFTYWPGRGGGKLNITTSAEAQREICGQFTAATTVDGPLHDPPYNAWVWRRTSGIGFGLPDPADEGRLGGRCRVLRGVGEICQVVMNSYGGEAGVDLDLGIGTVDLGVRQWVGVVGEGSASYVLLNGG